MPCSDQNKRDRVRRVRIKDADLSSQKRTHLLSLNRLSFRIDDVCDSFVSPVGRDGPATALMLVFEYISIPTREYASDQCAQMLVSAL